MSLISGTTASVALSNVWRVSYWAVQERGGDLRGNVKYMRRSGKLSTKHSARSSEKYPLLPPSCFSNHLAFFATSLPCHCFPLLLTAVSPSVLHSALPGLGPDLISDCPCQWVHWCFLLHFHLNLLQGLSGVVNSPGCQLSPRCLLGGYILSALQWSQPTGLFGQALDLLTSPAVCF